MSDATKQDETVDYEQKEDLEDVAARKDEPTHPFGELVQELITECLV